MFERFTPQAREVVVRAQTEARGLGHRWIGCEHLMLAALTQPEARGVAALHRLGVTPERFREQVAVQLGSPELGAADADALRALGINLDEVKRRVEASFGPGALDPPRPRRRGWLHWRRRDCDPPSGHIPFTPRAKKALELALRHAIHRKDREIRVEHLLLGMLSHGENVAVELLRALGVDPDAARHQLLRELDQAA